MKVLIITNRVPLPEDCGYNIAVNNIIKGFNEFGCNITLLSINTNKHFVNESSISFSFKNNIEVYTVNVNTDVTITGALCNLFTNKSYNISRFDSEELRNQLVRLLSADNFDIVQLEGLYVSMYTDIIRKYSKAKIIMRAHNVEYKIWERLSYSTSFLPKKLYLKLLTNRLRKYENNKLKDYDSIITFSNNDKKIFSDSFAEQNYYVNPIGIEDGKIGIRSCSEVNSIYFLGSLDWLPNVEGLEWFMSEIWEKVSNKFPELKFYIAGRSMPDSIRKINAKNVIICGEVEDAVYYSLSHNIMVVPLLSGSGIRVKILEALSWGKPVISTTIGAEGIEYENAKNIMIADNADEFIHAIDKIINDNEFANNLNLNATELIRQKYSNKEITSQLLKYYNTLLK
ncbi:MAG: glycosyltransferase family 4 protein [Bacteroidota bacterium]|nr:glycosyltransferase family 4 protein [Bacteroidota bacterium]